MLEERLHPLDGPIAFGFLIDARERLKRQGAVIRGQVVEIPTDA